MREGKASAMSLARDGVDLFITGRTAETLNAAAKEIADETGVTVTPDPSPDAQTAHRKVPR